MGILSVQCDGRNPKSGERCDHRFWRLLPRPEKCPSCGNATAAQHCVACGAPLAAGAKFCGQCARSKPTEITEELWALPDGVAAILHQVKVSPNSTEVYRVGPGVRILAFVEGGAITSGSGRDHFTVAPGSDGTISAIHAAALGKVICARLGRDPAGIDVVVLSSGPVKAGLEVADVRGRDDLPMSISLMVTADLIGLGAFVRFMAGRAVVTIEELEVAIADLAGPALRSRLGRWTAAELELPESRKLLAQQLAEDLAEDLAPIGLRMTGLNRLVLASGSLEEVRARRAAVREFDLETEAISSNIDAKGRREDLILGAIEADTARQERAESDDARRQRLAQAVRARITDDRVHEYRDADRFAKLVREVEHDLRLQGLIKEQELGALARKLANGERLEQLLSDIELRTQVRGNEIGEARHREDLTDVGHGADIQRKGKSADFGRDEAEKDADTARRIGDKDHSSKHAQLQDKLKLDHQDQEFTHKLEHDGKDKDVRRQIEAEDAAARRRHEELKIFAGMSPEQCIALKTTDPDVLKAILDSKRPSDDRVKVLEEEIRKLGESGRADQQKAYGEALSIAREAMQRMAEASASTGRQNINVNVPGSRGRGRDSDG